MFPPSSFRQSHATEPGKKPFFLSPSPREEQGSGFSGRKKLLPSSSWHWMSGVSFGGRGDSPSQKQPPELPCGEKEEEGFRPSCRVRGREKIYLFLRGKSDLKHGE